MLHRLFQFLQVERLDEVGGGAEVTEQRPQLSVGVEGLASVLLGGATWRSLAAAGLVRADDPAAVDVADRLFAVHDAPYAGFYF